MTAEHIVIAEKPFGTELRKIRKKAVKRILFVYTCVAKLIQFDLDYSTLTPPASGVTGAPILMPPDEDQRHHTMVRALVEASFGRPEKVT